MSGAFTMTSQLRLEVGGVVFSDWTSARLQRSLSEISGSFDLEYDDQLRMQTTLPRAEGRAGLTAIKPGLAARLLLDGELVLLGRIDDVDWETSADQVRARIVGRDMTGWLVDCSANPQGPAEYKELTVLEIATRLCAPFGISVRADVDVVAPLRDFGLELGETVMSAIDKAAKQRALLTTSDGVGGLVLTRSGTRRAPAPLSMPGNALSVGAHLSMRDRFSDYYVKGQSRPDRSHRKAKLDGTAMPLTARPAEADDTAEHSRRAVSSPGPVDGTAYPIGQSPPLAARSTTQTQRAAIISTGHVQDPAITGYRPRVFTVRSQSGDVSNQQLAEWRMRIARGRSTRNAWKVAGWRDGSDQRLWRPNEVVTIQTGTADAWDGLVAGVHYTQSDREGSATELEVVGREAYDLEPLPDQHRRHGAAKGSNVGNARIDRAPGGSSRR